MLGATIAPGEEHLPGRLVQTCLRWRAGGEVVGVELCRRPQEGGHRCLIDGDVRDTDKLPGCCGFRSPPCGGRCWSLTLQAPGLAVRVECQAYHFFLRHLQHTQVEQRA